MISKLNRNKTEVTLPESARVDKFEYGQGCNEPCLPFLLNDILLVIELLFPKVNQSHLLLHRIVQLFRLKLQGLTAVL